MVFSSLPAYLDPSNWQQQQRQQEEAQNNNDQQSGGGGVEAGGGAVVGTEAGSTGAGAERGTIHSSTFTNPEEVVLFPAVTPLQMTHYQLRQPTPTPTPTVLTHHHQPSSIRPGSMAERARLANIPMPEASLKCPRCESNNTKFCYFNNYNLSQPRHFCKTCRRYWTRGGALRNVPVGGGCRRRNNNNKQRSSSTTSCKGGSTSISSSTTSALLGAGRGGGCSTTSLISTNTSSSSSTSISDQYHNINIHGLNSVSPMPMPMASSNLRFFSSNYMPSPNNFNQYNFSSEFAELGLTGGSSSSYGGHDGGGDHRQEITKPGTCNNNNNNYNNITGSHMSGMRPTPQFPFPFPFPFTLLGGGGGGGGVCMDLEGSSFQGIGIGVGSPSNKILMLDSGGGADHDDQVIMSKTSEIISSSSDEFINGVQSFGNH